MRNKALVKIKHSTVIGDNDADSYFDDNYHDVDADGENGGSEKVNDVFFKFWQK